MDSIICTDVNNLLNDQCDLKRQVSELWTEIRNDDRLMITDLVNDTVTINKLYSTEIETEDINITGELTTCDIACKNLTAQDTVTAEDITCTNLAADNITADAANLTSVTSTTGNLTNVYSNYTETQTVVVTSDKKLKKEITDVKTDHLKDLKPVRFKYRNNDKKYVYGLIAQEVEPIYPDMIYTLQNGNKAIDYNQLISLLIFKTNGIEERLSSIEKTQASIKTFTGLLILALFIILILLFIPRKYLNFRYLLRVFTGR